MDITIVILAVITGLLIGALIVFLILQSVHEKLIREYEQKIQSMNQSYRLEIERARKESVEQSRNVLKGKMAEQMAPLLPGFKFLPADSRFLGDPVDYVVFDGYTHLRDGGTSGKDLELVILDIKQGQATLSTCQRAIAKAVEDGRVRFDVVRIFDDGTVKSHTWQSVHRKKEKVELPA